MLRVALAACLSLVAYAVAVASPLPIGSASETEAFALQVDYNRCVWWGDRRVCHTFYDDQDHDGIPGTGYYGAPGIYLGFGGNAYGSGFRRD